MHFLFPSPQIQCNILISKLLFERQFQEKYKQIPALLNFDFYFFIQNDYL